MTNTEKTLQQNAPATFSSKKRRLGRFLLIAGPLLVIAGCAYFYLTGGRFVHTDNAYIQADKVAISSQVSGAITAIEVQENAQVSKGQPLFTIDNSSYAINLEKARAQLQSVVAGIEGLKARFQQKQNELHLAELNTAFAKREYHRQANLDKYKAVAEARLDEATHNLEVSRQRVGIVRNELKQILAQLDGDPEGRLETQASYRLAKAEVERAKLDLTRTVVKAPFAGRISKLPKLGQYVETGRPVMSLIANSAFWVEANFKETELTHVHAGQPATIETDTYPDKKWQGTVASISPGTGSEYAILPAQNASGNWVKVVQRVPVRIAVHADANDPALLAGLSSNVRIDTGYHRPLPSLVQKALNSVGLGSNAWAR